MKDARLLASLAAVRRVLQRKPQTYWQAWLFAPLGPLPMGYIVALPILAAYKGWHWHWVAYAISYPAVLIGQGLAWTCDVHRGSKRGRHVSTES